MKKLLFILFVALLFPILTTSYSFSSSKLNTNDFQKDKRTVDSLLDISDELIFSSTIGARIVCDSAYRLGLKINYTDGWGRALSSLIGLNYFAYGENHTNLLVEFAKFILSNTDNSKLKCYLLMSLGKHYSYKSDFDNSSLYFLKALDLAEKKQIKELMPEVYYSLGWFYQLIGDWDNAADNFLHSVHYYNENRDTSKAVYATLFATESLISKNQLNLVYNYINEVKHKINFNSKTRTLGYYYKILALADLKNKDFVNAVKNLNYAISVLEPIKSRQHLSDIYTLLAHISGLNKDYKSSIEYNYKALASRRELNSLRGITSSYVNIGVDHFMLGNQDSSLYYLNIGYKMAFELKSYNYYLRAADWLQKNYTISKKTDSVIKYLTVYKELTEKLNSREISRNTIKYQMKNELDKKDISLMEIKLKQSQTGNIYTLLILILIIAFSIVIFYKFRQNRRDNLILIEQKSLLEKANEEIRINEEKLKNLNSELDNLINERTLNLIVEIEQRKKAEDNLLHSKENIQLSYEKEKELNKMKSRFINMISHEFRTPMTIITTSNEIIHYYGEKFQGEIIKNHCEKIKNAIIQMTSLIEEIIAFNTTQLHNFNLRFDNINLSELMLEIINEQKLSYKSKVNIISDTGTSQISINSDKKLITHILSNLIGNAVKYTPNDKNIHIKIQNKMSLVEIVIHDEGIGIPESDLSRIFEPFYRGYNIENISGTGFGLYLVQDFVKKLNGDIKISSEINKGTTINLVIPLKT
jgi:signal transduction histidine kinase